MLESLTLDPVFALLIKLAFALLFALAAWHKLVQRQTFAGVLLNYHLFSHKLVPVLVWLVPVLELTLVLLLLLPGYSPLAASLVSLTLSGYALAMAINLYQGRILADCGCHFGDQPQSVSWGLVVRNLLLAGVALTLWLPAAERSLVWLDSVILLLGLLALSGLYQVANTLMNNHVLLNRARS